MSIYRKKKNTMKISNTISQQMDGIKLKYLQILNKITEKKSVSFGRNDVKTWNVAQNYHFNLSKSTCLNQQLYKVLS